MQYCELSDYTNTQQTLNFIALRTNKNAYIQTFCTREVPFDGLFRDLFREQTIVSCSSITFSNIPVRVFNGFPLACLCIHYQKYVRESKIV